MDRSETWFKGLISAVQKFERGLNILFDNKQTVI